MNGLYDPFGFTTPVVIRGKALIRELTTETCDWDAPLPPEKMSPWGGPRTSRGGGGGGGHGKSESSIGNKCWFREH